MSDVLDNMASELALSIAKKKDALIHEAICRRLNCKDYQLEATIARLTSVINPRRPGITLITLDGEPLLEIHPLETRQEETGNTSRLHVTFKFRTFP